MLSGHVTLPRAVALAQELERDLQHLDALQQHYAQLLVHQLSSFDVLDDGDATATDAAVEPTTAHSEAYVDAKPEVVVATVRLKRPSTRPPSWRHPASDSARVPQLAFRHRDRPAFDTVNGSASPPRQPSASTSEPPPPLPPPPKRRGKCAANPRAPRPNAGTTCHALTQQQPHVTVTPAVAASHKDEEAQRARRALRLIREERDAYFNAKARRAKELLREGREAAQKSRARRQAEAARSLSLSMT
ncbi:hypothetical protein LSCM1_07722 [Leishmania martiniquensis]|uniref:Uncharacterized protein n=1 Tax=Leishmania martiniquensis TaxID=1580590 RepID=A0A836HIY5_9TRYP|nr:hypothetical protein LSCM1_07722 [Leishmania martiniquensis]